MRIIGNNPAADNAEITAVASGTLPNGKPVIVNANGTVSAAAETAVSQTLGSANVFDSGDAYDMGSAFDTGAGKVVIAYRDYVNSNSQPGHAVVGTVSGSNTSFGSEATFNSGKTEWVSVAYDENAGKSVVLYRDASNSGYLTCAVGTISGTNISFGSEVVVESVGGRGQAICYDSDTNKIIVMSSNKAYVGTINNTSISFGSGVAFDTGNMIQVAAAYDTSASKVVVCYRHINNSNRGQAIIGTVSGTGISFGSAVVFDSSAVNYLSAVYHSGEQKVVIAYSDQAGGSAPGKPYLIVGDVSGTSISFGAQLLMSDWTAYANNVTYDPVANKIVGTSGSLSNGGYSICTVTGTSITKVAPADDNAFDVGRLNYITSAYDSVNEKVVIVYSAAGTSSDGTTRVLQPAYNSTNLTAENFIGFANGAASDTGTARVQIGSGINTAQSSLTAGQQYFVQGDGTLGLTASSPSVIAGTAVSATDIIVKG